jgi:uncharacterized membrane protein
MLFLVVLFVAYAVLWPFTRHSMTFRSRGRSALAVGMAFAGVAHFVTPQPFVQHLPDVIPMREAVIYASGAIEISLGLALLGVSRWRPFAGLALAAYLVAVFPGNLYVAVAGVAVDGQPGGIYPWFRLPFQALFIFLALWSTDALSVVPARFVPSRFRAMVVTSA